MKANVRYIVLGVLLGALTTQARVFETGERLYFNGSPANFSTWSKDVELWCNLKKGANEYWLQAQWPSEAPYIPYIEIPSAAAGDWDYIVMARCEPGNRYTIYNQTGEISFYENKNYIENFCYGTGWKDAYWGSYIPAPKGDPSSWVYDDEQICTSAAGTEYILAPKNYDYSDRTLNHAWFEYDGSNWIRLEPGATEWVEVGERDYTVTLGAAGYDRYFFYQCSTPSKCRLVRIRLNQDCSEGAPGACKITSFVAVASEANVTDQTCAINGVVAFDDKKNAGDLMVWCENIDTVTVLNTYIETPQTFKLKGFDASTTKSYTIHAKFLGGTSECEASYVVTVHPPTAPITTHDNTQTGTLGSHDRDLVRFTEEDVTLTPTNQTSTYFQWTNSADDDKITGKKPEKRNLTFTAPTEQKDIEYVFLATQDPPEPAGNLIENGTFEDASKDAILESNYDWWERDVSDYYKSHPGASGGYAVVQNSTDFYHTYNTVKAHQGDYFALFDSKVYDGTDQAAWIASSALNPKLKVEAGVSYLFSFWVANINNFGEMNNGAQLQFQISYNGGSTWNNLGSAIDLGDYKDNRWHGMSSIATPSTSSTNVKIRVINLNTSLQNRGNDFALDDIRFEAVTANTSHIAAFERFPVKYLKCVITGATFTQQQPVGCGTTTADVNYRVDFVNPRGDLYIYQGTTELAHIAHDDLKAATYHEGVLPARPVDNTNPTLTVYFEDALVRTDAPTTYTYDAKALPVINVKSLTWTPLPACDQTTATLTAVIEYTNQNGTLSADVDGGTAVSASYTVESDDKKEVTLVIPGVVADGETGHKLNVSFSGSHGCSIVDHVITEAAPYMPNIKTVTTTVLHEEYDCSSEQYKVKVEAEFANGQGHRIIFKDWYTGKEQKVDTDPMDSKAFHIFTYDWETPASHEYNVYFQGAKGCDHKKSYTSPARPVLTAERTFTATGCDITTYTLQLDLTYTNQKGSKFYAKVDDGIPVSLANPNVAAQSSKSDVTLSITGLPADGKDHKYSIWTDDAADCSLMDVAFTAPFGPKISSATSTVQPFACGDDKYKVNVEVAFTNGQGHNLIIEDWKGNKQTISTIVGDTKKEYLFSYDWEAPTTHAYKVYFEGNEACKESHKPLFDVPFLPLIDAVVVEGKPAEPLSCGTSSYDVNVKVTTHFDATGYDIILNYNDNGTDLTKKMSATGTETTIPLTLHNLDAADQTITAKIDVASPCPKDVTYTPAQLKHITPLFDVTVGENACGPLDYTVSGTVSFNKPDGKLIVLYDDSHSDTIDVASDATSASFSIEHMTASGASMVLKAKFTGSLDDACTVSSNTFAAPTKPAIEAKKLTFSDVTCTDMTAALTFDLDYTFQQGKLHYNVDGGTDSVKVITEKSSSLITLSGLKYEGIPADGKSHTLHISFDGANSCTKDVATPSAPLSYVIDEVVLTTDVPSMVTCETASYDVEVKVTAHFDATGKKVVLMYNDNGTSVTTDPIEVSGKTATKTITLHNLANGLHTISAAFSTKQDCKTTSAAYTAPSIAQIHDFTVTTSPRTCDDDKFTISGSIAFDMADGNLTVYYDDDHKQVFPAPVTSPVAFSIPNMTEASHTVKAWFGDSPSDGCKKESAAFTAPTKPAIEAKKLTFSDVTCSDVTAALTFDLDYTFQQGKLHYNVDGGTDSVKVITEKSSSLITLSGLKYEGIPADGKSHTLHISFDGANSCTKDVATLVAPLSYVIDAVVLTTDVPAMVTCETASYDVEVKVTTHFDATGKKVVLIYNENGTTVTTDPIDVIGKTATKTITLHNLANGSHTISAAFSTKQDCKTTSAAYTAPSIAQIHDFTVTTSSRACDDDKFTISGSIAFDMADGNLTVYYDDDHKQVFPAPVTSPVAFSIPNMTEASHTVKAWFGDSPSDGCKKESAAFTAPTKPTIEVKKLTFSDVTCTDVTAALTFDLDYTFQQGKLHFNVDGGTDSVKVITEKSSSPITLSGLKYEGIPADGKSHTLHISFDGANSCTKDVALGDAPFSNALTSVAVTSIPTMILCDQTEYNAVVTVAMPFDKAIGRTLVIAYEGKTETVVTTSNPMVTTVKMTKTDASGLTIEAYFEGAEGCKVTSPAFTAPERLTCNKYPITVCEGDSYTWPLTGLSYGPFTEVGIDTIVSSLNVHDSLFVTVNAQPEITLTAIDPVIEDATEIKLPFTVTKGTPNKFVITLNGVTTSQKRGLTDEIVLAKPSTLTPGTYTVTVAVHDTLTDCQSETSTTITIIEKTIIPSLSISNVTPSIIDACDKVSSVAFDMEYLNQTGTLTFWLDDNKDAAKTASFTPNTKTAQTLTGLTITDVPADGMNHKLHVAFNDETTGKAETTFDAPLSNALISVAVTSIPTMILCDQTEYNAVVTVAMPFDKAIGRTLVIAYEGKTEKVVTTSNPMVTTVKMTKTDASGLIIEAYFEGSEGCKVTSPAFTAPERLTCNKYPITVCEGDSYTWPLTGLNYGPFTEVGIDTIVSSLNVHDSLFVTVNAQPEITLTAIDPVIEDATEIKLPFTVTKGTPNKFVITLNGATTSQKRGLTDEIVLAKPASLVPGSYTVTIEVQDTITGCHSETSTSLTIEEKAVTPSVSIRNVVPSIADACEKTSSVTFDVDYLNQTGTLTYWLDDLTSESKTSPFTAGSKTPLTVTGLTLDNVPADGLIHKLHVTFNEETTGKAETDFTAPLSNALTSVAVTSIPTMVLCDQTEYNAVISVSMPFDKAIGRKIVIAYEGKTETVVVTSNPMVSTVQMTKTGALGLTVEAWFEGAPSCKVTSAAYTAPEKLSCDKYLATVCEGDSYTWPLTGLSYGPFTTPGIDTIVNSLNIHDSLFVTVNALPEISIATIAPVVEDAEEIHIPYTVTGGTPNKFVITLNGATSSQKRGLTDEIVLSKPASLVPGSYTVTVEVQDTITVCHSETSTSLTIEEKAVTPSVSIRNVVPSIADACEKTSSVTFDVEYLNQTGTLTYWLDDLTSESKTSPFTAGSKTPLTVTGLTLDNVPADGLVHKLHVAFNDETTGKAETDFTAPLSNALTSVAVTSIPTMVLCDQTEYNAVVSVSMPFDKAIGRKIVIAYEGKTETVVVTSNPMVATVKMTKTDASGLTVEAYFEGAEACKVTSPAYTAPEKLSCDKYLATVCEGDSYTWPLTGLSYGPFTEPGIDTIVNSLNVHDTLFVTVNALPEISIATIAPVVEDAMEIHIPYTVTGGTPNRFVITLNGATSSQKRGLTDEIVLSKPASLVPGSYTVTVEVQDTITGCHSETSTSLTIEEKTVTPSVSILNVVPSIADECGKLSSVTFDVDYLNQTGTLTYWLDDLTSESKTSPFTAGSKTPLTVTGLTLDNVPADGLVHKLHVTFNEETTGKAETDFTAPLTHAIESVTVSGVPASIACNENTYTVTVTIHLPFAAPTTKLVINVEGRDTAVYAGDETDLIALIPMSTTNATGLTVTARHCEAPACPVTSPVFDAPKQEGCIKDFADICEGEAYTWERHDLEYGPFTSAGLYTYTHENDSLFLIVRAQPAIRVDAIDRICKDETEIRWPFAVTAGTPDVFTVRINGNDYNVTADGSELVLPIPADLPAGDYTAVFTVKDAAISCTTTSEAALTLAAGDLIYSKWEDLLFVNNVDNIFVTFQWYENGNIIVGENKQYLFNQNGLPGLYFCQMTTTDNRIIYTCEIPFENAIPSRTVSGEGKEAQSVKIYDPMGRTITGTPDNGIYIIVEEVDGIRIVRKIAVYE